MSEAQYLPTSSKHNPRGPDLRPRVIRSDSPKLPSYLGRYFAGADPDHTRHWLTQMRAGYAAAPRCERVRSNGSPCMAPTMRGSCFCVRHVSAAERLEIDEHALTEAMFTLARVSAPTIRARAEERIRSILRRQLRHRWQTNPMEEGTTLALSEHDEGLVRDWLRRECSVDIADGTHTPRFIDDVRWIALRCLNMTVPQDRACKMVVRALETERKWRQEFARRNSTEATPDL